MSREVVPANECESDDNRDQGILEKSYELCFDLIRTHITSPAREHLEKANTIFY